MDRTLRDARRRAPAGQVLRQAKAPLSALLRERFTTAEAQALALKLLNLLSARRCAIDGVSEPGLRPVGLVVDPSNACLLACPGCVHSQSNEKSGRFDWPKGTLAETVFARLLELYGPTAVGVYLCNYGEPLLNRHTPDLIRAAKRYLMGTALSTSLSVARFDPEAYVESGLDQMVVSIDGATQEVYGRFRCNGNLELALENLRRLVEVKRRLKRAAPVLSWNYLAFEHNAHEIRAAARMAMEIGVNLFRVVKPFDVSWDDAGVRTAGVAGVVRRFDLQSSANPPENWNPFPAEVEAGPIGRAFEHAWETDAGAAEPAGRACHWLHRNLVMDANGRILPCCGPPRRGAGLPFATIEDPDPFQSVRHRDARAGSAAAPCGGCEWDQAAVNVGAREIRRYFRAADPALFHPRCLALLSEW